MFFCTRVVNTAQQRAAALNQTEKKKSGSEIKRLWREKIVSEGPAITGPAKNDNAQEMSQIAPNACERGGIKTNSGTNPGSDGGSSTAPIHAVYCN